MQIKSTDIQLVNLETLIPYKKNMNKHSDEQIDRLCKLIEYQGFRDPLIVQKDTNVVAAGNGRLVAAKKLGIKEVPVTYQEFDSEDQLYAFVVSHNAIAKDSWASLDLSLVNAELENLGPIDIDFLGLKDFEIEPLDKIKMINSGDENSEWVDMPDFEPGEKEIRLTYLFQNELQRQQFADENNITVTNKHSGQWTVRV